TTRSAIFGSDDDPLARARRTNLRRYLPRGAVSATDGDGAESRSRCPVGREPDARAMAAAPGGCCITTRIAGAADPLLRGPLCVPCALGALAGDRTIGCAGRLTVGVGHQRTRRLA